MEEDIYMYMIKIFSILYFIPRYEHFIRQFFFFLFFFVNHSVFSII